MTSITRSTPSLLSARPLPVTDTAALRSALAEADLPTLAMVLVHYRRDQALLDRIAPYIGSVFDAPREFPPQLAQEIRDALYAVLTAKPPPAELPLPHELMQRMMSVDVAEPVAQEFIPMLLEQMGFEQPQPLKELPGRPLPPQDFSVIVIGAGLTGILAGIKLAEAGYSYRILEKNRDIGGTWLENVYPGCAVDTPSHFYSYSFELNPDWSHYTPKGPEFQQYLLQVVEKYQLRRQIDFGVRVQGAAFDEAAGEWEVRVEDAHGARTLRANAIINAHGPLNRWSLPAIPGLESFRGIKLHTAGWDPAVQLAGKRVAMIGTGASAAQLGPAIAPEVAHLTVFQRSRHWVMPNQEVPVSGAMRWAMRYIPHFAEWFRFRAYWFAADGLYANILIDPQWPHQDRSISAHNDAVREYCLANYRAKLASRPDLLQKLVPDYPVFGKRIVMDVGWLDTLCRDNVTLEDEPIDHITDNAIVLRDGRRIEVDAILFATGFHISRMCGDLQIIGRDGRNLGEEWGEDDPRAYLGVMAPGFPNYFFTVGPNSAPNHAGGQNITSECQVHYIIECLDLVVRNGARAVEVTEPAFEHFNQQVDADLQRLIWTHPKASSYYRNSRGRVFLSCPYRLVDYWNMTREPRVQDLALR